MSRALEKKTKKNRRIIGNEVEATLFIRHVKKLFPDIAIQEMRKFLARHGGINASYCWVMKKMNSMNSEMFLTQNNLAEEEVVKINEEVESNVQFITQESLNQVRGILADSQKKAFSIKHKMMDEIDIRLDSEGETFTNDELIRGSKTMHEIETNSERPVEINININPDEINNTINELNRKKQAISINPGGGEDA